VGSLGMVERSVRDLREDWSDAEVAGNRDDGRPSRRRSGFLRSSRENPPVPAPTSGPRKRRRSKRLAILRGLKRVWIPLAIVVVVTVGGITVSRLHGIFGSEKRLSYGDTRIDNTKPFKPKRLVYEVFGAPGTVADISYIEPNGDPKMLPGVTLPWRMEIAATQNTSVGNLMAQGNSDSIGCRIVIDDVVKSEHITNEEQAFASCIPKAA
jgi:hypothetical protein